MWWPQAVHCAGAAFFIAGRWAARRKGAVRAITVGSNMPIVKSPGGVAFCRGYGSRVVGMGRVDAAALSDFPQARLRRALAGCRLHRLEVREHVQNKRTPAICLLSSARAGEWIIELGEANLVGQGCGSPCYLASDVLVPVGG